MKKSVLAAAILAAAVLLSATLTFASESPDVIKLKKDIEITKGMVVNDVIVVDGNLKVSGRIDGSVVVVGGAVALENGSYVGGDIVVVGEILRDPGAHVTGKVTQVYMPSFIPDAVNFFKGGWVAFWAALGLLALVGFIGLSVLVIALMPAHMGVIVSSLDRSFLTMFLWGLLATLLVAPVAVLLAISIIGIVLIPVEMIAVALALLVGYIASAILIGNKVFEALKRPAIPFVNAVLGILILGAVGYIPVVGAVLKTVFLMAGYGAVAVSRLGTVSRRTDIA